MSTAGVAKIRFGNKPGFSVRVMFDGRLEETGRAGLHVVDAVVDDWTRAAVITSKKSERSLRFFALESVADGEESEFAPSVHDPREPLELSTPRTLRIIPAIHP